MNKTGVVHNQDVNESESLALASLARLREDLSLSSTKGKKGRTESFIAFKVMTNGVQIKSKTGQKRLVTFINETDRAGRQVQHYMGICETTGTKQMLSRFKPTKGL